MEDKILLFVKWAIIVPIFLVENILKSITFILWILAVIVLAIIYPLVKNASSNGFTIGWREYATNWTKGYYISRKIHKLWS